MFIFFLYAADAFLLDAFTAQKEERAPFVEVRGAVVAPFKGEVAYDLKYALKKAGGLKFFADRSHIYLIREGNSYRFHINHIEQMKEGSFKLQYGDKVDVYSILSKKRLIK